MGLKEKAEKLKKKKSVARTNTASSAEHETENLGFPSTNFGTIAALIVGAIGIILLKGRKS